MNQNEFSNAQFEHKPNGYIIIDGQEVAHTLQCCHCEVHFLSVRGSGKIRGFCLKCQQITCGEPACDVCVPFEKKLEAEEKQFRQDQTKRDVIMELHLKEIEKIEKQYGTSLTIGEIKGGEKL